jgi:hypothetical protein
MKEVLMQQNVFAIVMLTALCLAGYIYRNKDNDDE